MYSLVSLVMAFKRMETRAGQQRARGVQGEFAALWSCEEGETTGGKKFHNVVLDIYTIHLYTTHDVMNDLCTRTFITNSAIYRTSMGDIVCSKYLLGQRQFSLMKRGKWYFHATGLVPVDTRLTTKGALFCGPASRPRRLWRRGRDETRPWMRRGRPGFQTPFHRDKPGGSKCLLKNALLILVS